jgi:hypothetical protein
VLATQQKGDEHIRKLEEKGDSVGEIGIDRREVNREEWMLDVLAFHIAQVIVGEDGFVGGSEGIVAGEREWLFWCVDISPCACVCGRSDEPIPRAGPRGTLQGDLTIQME